MAYQCARRGCDSTSEWISYKKPLCYEHWEEWDAFGIEECARCNWFVDEEKDGLLYHTTNEQSYEGEIDLPCLCDDCFIISFHERGEQLPWSGGPREGKEHAPHLHSPILRHARYVYILKRDDNSFYVGQTIDLTLRYQEHRDGAHPTTKGTNPKLVYYEEIHGDRTDANGREDELTLMALNGHGRRIIRDLIENFRTHLRLVDFEA